MKNADLLALLNPGIALIFATTFLIFWSRQREKYHLLGLGVAYLFLGAGFSVSHLQSDWRDAYSLITKHSLYSCGTISLLWAVNARVGTKTFIKSMIAIMVLSGTLLALVAERSDQINAQLYVMNFAYGPMFVLGIWTVRKRVFENGVEILLFVALLLSAAQFFVRPIATFAIDEIVYESSYRESLYWAVLNAVVATCSLVLALSLIAACASDLIAQIKAASQTDLLTGLKNRRAFDEALSDVLAKAERTPLPLSFVIVDIDHFKQVNDTYGHQCGDQVIAAMGELISSSGRDTDLRCRMGGEEFGILLWNCDMNSAKMFAEGLRTSFESLKVKTLPSKLRCTASFGVAEWQTGEEFDDLYGRADECLYRAKAGGRNRVIGGETGSVAIQLREAN